MRSSPLALDSEDDYADSKLNDIILRYQFPIPNMNTENPASTDQSSEIADTSANPASFTLPPAAKRLPAWRLWVPLLLQIGLIAAVPAPAVYTFITGKTVVLQTAPVDPYDFLRGYYQVLSYDISDRTNLQKLPGWKDLADEKIPCPPAVVCPQNTHNVKPQTSFYVILEAPKPRLILAAPKLGNLSASVWKIPPICPPTKSQLRANITVGRWNTA